MPRRSRWSIRPPGLRPGMTAKVAIRVETIPDALQVPIQAVVERGGKHYCLLARGASGSGSPRSSDRLDERKVPRDPRRSFAGRRGAVESARAPGRSRIWAKTSRPRPTSRNWPRARPSRPRPGATPRAGHHARAGVMIVVRLRAWRMGVRSLRLHPLRSLLTILGILVGVASVIWLLAIGQGISSRGAAADRRPGRRQHHRPLDQAAARRRATVRAARGVVEYGLTRAISSGCRKPFPRSTARCRCASCGASFAAATYLVDGRLVGCTPEYAAVTHLEVERGRFLDRRRRASSSATSACWRPAWPNGCFRSKIRWAGRSASRTCTTSWSASSKTARPSAGIGGSLDCAGLLQRRLHSDQRSVGPHRRHRRHAAQRLVRGRDAGAQPDHAARRRGRAT